MTRVSDERFSHRGRGLLLMGLVWILVGVDVLTTPPNSTDAVVFPLTLLEPQMRAVIWITTGALALFCAITGVSRERTKWAFAGLLIPVTFRCLSFAVSTVGALLGEPGAQPVGTGDAYIYALIGHAISWFVVGLFVLHEAATPVLPATLHPKQRSL